MVSPPACLSPTTFVPMHYCISSLFRSSSLCRCLHPPLTHCCAPPPPTRTLYFFRCVPRALPLFLDSGTFWRRWGARRPWTTASRCVTCPCAILYSSGLSVSTYSTGDFVGAIGRSVDQSIGRRASSFFSSALLFLRNFSSSPLACQLDWCEL